MTRLAVNSKFLSEMGSLYAHSCTYTRNCHSPTMLPSNSNFRRSHNIKRHNYAYIIGKNS